MQSTVRFCAALLGLAAASQAGVIVEVTAGSASNSAAYYYGQSFTTPGSGLWDHISFSFLDGLLNDYAVGNGYLFHDEFLGPPTGLPGGSGLVAMSLASGGTYRFSPLVRLLPGTTYYLYADSPVPGGSFRGGSIAPGGNLYFTPSAAVGFNSAHSMEATSVSANYRVTGSVVQADSAVPEPETMAMVGVGLILVVRWMRRRK